MLKIVELQGDLNPGPKEPWFVDFSGLDEDQAQKDCVPTR